MVQGAKSATRLAKARLSLRRREALKKVKGKVSVSLPVYQDSAATIESFLYESITRWEMLKNVLVRDVVDFDDEMLVALEQIPIDRQAQYRDHVSNASLVQCFFPP